MIGRKDDSRHLFNHHFWVTLFIYRGGKSKIVLYENLTCPTSRSSYTFTKSCFSVATESQMQCLPLISRRTRVIKKAINHSNLKESLSFDPFILFGEQPEKREKVSPCFDWAMSKQTDLLARTDLLLLLFLFLSTLVLYSGSSP